MSRPAFDAPAADLISKVEVTVGGDYDLVTVDVGDEYAGSLLAESKHGESLARMLRAGAVALAGLRTSGECLLCGEREDANGVVMHGQVVLHGTPPSRAAGPCPLDGES